MTVFTTLIHSSLDFIATTNPGKSSLVSETFTQILFLDYKVVDYQHLLSGIKPGIYPVLLNSETDGILQISEQLSRFEHLEAIHLVCYGTPGEIYLGNTALNLSNLSIYLELLQQWSKALYTPADLLIYSCEVAIGWQGKAFVKALGEIIQAHVAASPEKLGQGECNFSITTGKIKTELAFEASVLKTYNHRLGFQ